MVAAVREANFDTMPESHSPNATSFTTYADSGDAFDLFSGSGGTSLVTSAADVYGGKGIEIYGNAVSRWFEYSGFTNSIVGFRTGINIPSDQMLPTSIATFIQIRDDTGGLTVVHWNTTGTLTLANGAGTTEFQYNGNTALPTGKYYLWLAIEAGTTTSNGKIYSTLRNATTDAIIDNHSNTSANTTRAGTASTPNRIRFGKTGGGGEHRMRLDQIGYALSLSEIDRPAAPDDGWIYRKFVRLG
jgi:hypothetical protein